MADRTLDSLTIAKPCAASWDAMEPSPGGRHCALCERPVHDLSVRTRAEAEALLRASPGRLCVRIARDADGRIVTRSAGERRASGGALARLGRRLLGAASLLAAACGTGEQSPGPGSTPGEPVATLAPPASRATEPPSEQERRNLERLAELGYVADTEEPGAEATPQGPTEEQRRLFAQLGALGYVETEAEPSPGSEARAPSVRCPEDR